jgi:hypothetical protein
MTRFEVANTGRCFNTAEPGDALHRTNESRVIDQDRGDMVASPECTACVFCSHNELFPTPPFSLRLFHQQINFHQRGRAFPYLACLTSRFLADIMLSTC